MTEEPLRHRKYGGLLSLKNLELSVHLGIDEAERQSRQPVFVDAEIDVYTSSITELDSLERESGYGEFYTQMMNASTIRRFNLLETLAESLATAILQNSYSAHAVELEVRRPLNWNNNAYASVKIRRERNRSYLGIKASSNNDEDQYKLIDEVIENLERNNYSLNNSSVWGSVEPEGLDQMRSMSAVVEMSGRNDPEWLEAYARAFKGISYKFGKLPDELEIVPLLCGSIVTYGDYGLELPYSKLHEDPYYLHPLAELAPDLMHPLIGKKLRDLSKKIGYEEVHVVRDNHPFCC